MTEINSSTNGRSETPGEELARLQHLVLGFAACDNDDTINARINELLEAQEMDFSYAESYIAEGIDFDDDFTHADMTGHAICPDYRPDTAFEFATNQ